MWLMLELITDIFCHRKEEKSSEIAGATDNIRRRAEQVSGFYYRIFEGLMTRRKLKVALRLLSISGPSI